ncbi:MAG: phosphotransferase [Acidaminococcales bacterium]|nr:phosphotransferase [Acidaminococcales bacterium]
MAEFMPVASISEITYFVKILFSHIYNCDAVENTKANTIFRKKISELAENIKMSEPIRKSLALLKSFDWRYASESPCHGDLTLENIIVAPDKKLYLIDFLDSFYNSYLMDLAKLFRDLELGWSFRKQPVSTNRSLRLLIAKEAIMRELAELENAPQIIT